MKRKKTHPISVVPRHTSMINDKKICKFGHFLNRIDNDLDRHDTIGIKVALH